MPTSKSEHYNCPAIKIASMPGGGTTVGEVHDAIENLLATSQREAEIRAKIEELKRLPTVQRDNFYGVDVDVDNKYVLDRIAELEAQLKDIT